jgi:hypothetical protein
MTSDGLPPGWEAWQSIRGGQWHARLKGAEPPRMVHDDSLEGIRQQLEHERGGPGPGS